MGLTTLPTSCADCLEIWDPQPLGILRACRGLNRIALPFPYSFLLEAESTSAAGRNM